MAAKLAAVAARGRQRARDTSPTVKFPALAVLLMVNVLPVIVAELSRPTLAALVMLAMPDTGLVAYSPLTILDFWSQNAAKRPFFAQKTLVTDVTLRRRSVFGAKSAENGELRKVRFFVSGVFWPEKPANSTR